MPRNRIISASQGIFVGPSPATGGHYISGVTKVISRTNATGLVRELYRVQDYNYSFSFDKTPVNQFGDLAAIDYIELSPATVNFSTSYILSNFANEKALGFTISSGSLVGVLSGILAKTEDDKNYFIDIVSEGQDANQAGSTTTALVGFGNGYITNYSINAAVNQFPNVSIDIEALNGRVYNTFSGFLPAIIPASGTAINNIPFEIPTGTTNLSGFATNANVQSLSVLRPGDMTLSFGYSNLGASTDDWKVQSFDLTIPISRENIDKLGSRFSVTKEITFPVNATFSVNAIVGDMVTGNLVDLFNDCSNHTYNATVSFASPCGGSNIASYIMRGAELTSQEFSSSIGGNKTVTMNFIVPIGGPAATGNNIFFSGVAY